MEANTILAFLKKASEDEGLRKELVALAGRYGIPLGSDELSDASLDQVAGGLLQGFDLSSPKLQTSLLRQSKVSIEGPPIKMSIDGIYKLGDGSV